MQFLVLCKPNSWLAIEFPVKTAKKRTELETVRFFTASLCPQHGHVKYCQASKSVSSRKPECYALRLAIWKRRENSLPPTCFFKCLNWNRNHLRYDSIPLFFVIHSILMRVVGWKTKAGHSAKALRNRNVHTPNTARLLWNDCALLIASWAK